MRWGLFLGSGHRCACAKQKILGNLPSAICRSRQNVHKADSVLQHLPKEQHAGVKRAQRDAWATADANLRADACTTWPIRCKPSTGLVRDPARRARRDADAAAVRAVAFSVPRASKHQPDRESQRPNGEVQHPLLSERTAAFRHRPLPHSRAAQGRVVTQRDNTEQKGEHPRRP